MRFHLSRMATAMALSGLLLPLAQAQVTPDAGQSIREIEQAPLSLPTRQTLDLELPDDPAGEAEPGGPSLWVEGFRLSGNRAIADDTLLALLDDLRQRTLGLGEVRGAAERISHHYRERGYPLARAYLPPQEIEDGVVEIAVLEGHYGEVRLDNRSRLRDGALATPLAALAAGDAVRAKTLERSLLLLQDIPGVAARATLAPGSEPGTSDLLIEADPGPLLSGSLEADNHGNRYTGEYRLGGTLHLNSPLGLGDRLSLRALGSDEDQQYYRAAYQLPVGPWSTQLGVAYSDMDYELARDFSDLDAHGNARIASGYAIQPLLRSRDLSLYAQLQYDDKRLRDRIDLFDQRSDKRSRVVTAALHGNSRDDLFGGGVNAFGLAWSHGRLSLDDALDELIDRLTADTQGHFNTLSPSLVRLQRLDERFSLYARLQGQWADSNLDSSEKFGLGGAHGVRAYPQGEALGDQGYLANLELRYALTPAWQLSSFLDHGRVRLDKDPWSDGDNHRSLSGAGVGATWAAHGWYVNAVAAWKLGSDEPRSDSDRSPRIWAQVAKTF
ncbi:ShlB/FhaC/HecB family hemolysin secretion/activation protein [Billgrantia endophytica]|uniref:ShlB/FhaC/HecB family hemolysin secretion/activation protein n=1 Tax=Billgrantia endophytica TaxID=2033802 RepID=A0A2N7U8T7_9GAMM|nr:ShlB/FhaC/HecB family hemolysin secretion/activation protein [Halomonas endophytica]PMR76843.1 hypothetical protein C1H69_03835 [Halomonas endophytica]